MQLELYLQCLLSVSKRIVAKYARCKQALLSLPTLIDNRTCKDSKSIKINKANSKTEFLNKIEGMI